MGSLGLLGEGNSCCYLRYLWLSRNSRLPEIAPNRESLFKAPGSSSEFPTRTCLQLDIRGDWHVLSLDRHGHGKRGNPVPCSLDSPRTQYPSRGENQRVVVPLTRDMSATGYMVDVRHSASKGRKPCRQITRHWSNTVFRESSEHALSTETNALLHIHLNSPATRLWFFAPWRKGGHINMSSSEIDSLYKPTGENKHNTIHFSTWKHRDLSEPKGPRNRRFYLWGPLQKKKKNVGKPKRN